MAKKKDKMIIVCELKNEIFRKNRVRRLIVKVVKNLSRAINYCFGKKKKKPLFFFAASIV